MRPLRLLLSLSTSLVTITLLLYVAFGSQHDEELRSTSTTAQKSKFTALLSFTSPGSLFPPSAIISLTDDNSTFFLARPAAFGPALPSSGLSGPLWVGTGFGDDITGKGELGCSDVPGWDDGSESAASLGRTVTIDTKSRTDGAQEHGGTVPPTKHARAADVESSKAAERDDGTDDHLHQPIPASSPPKARGKSSGHADIQSLQESAEIAGKVVLLKRGGCGFLEKVKWAQRRGGVALIVGDDVRGGSLVRMYARGDTSNVSIPSLFTSYTTAHLLSSLLPTGGLMEALTPEDAAKLSLIKSGKGGKNNKAMENSRKNQYKAARPFSQTGQKSAAGESVSVGQSDNSQKTSWLHSLLSVFRPGNSARTTSTDDSRRLPSSGKLDWANEEQKPVGTKSVTAKTTTTSTPLPGDFTIGEQDWRDSTILPESTLTNTALKQTSSPGSKLKGGSVLPSSGEYTQDSVQESNRWLNKMLGSRRDDISKTTRESDNSGATVSSDTQSQKDDDSSDTFEPHEGLWVTLTPTNMSTSPFFDTLLVLVVSPLVTLTVVYALLLLRSRIRRRRWRAPKSLVERLPVRTYHTISDTSPSATPNASSPTTPLLQHSPPRPSSSHSRPRSLTEPELPATSSSFRQPHRTPEEEKRESGLAAWRRRYGGRQRECVVCLEEYEDGISQVMSLPCGHEFHADCITPWLVTRRRTCPICKGDVVRSLSQTFHERTVSAIQSARFHDDVDDLQAQAAETRNDSPSASQPVPISADGLDADIEANWAGDEEGGREVPRQQGGDLSSSLRDVSSSVATTIWRGFEVVGRAAGFQRRSSREEVDRDR